MVERRLRDHRSGALWRSKPAQRYRVRMTPWILGREDLTCWLTDALQQAGCAVALHAGPGMGKSTLLRATTWGVRANDDE